MLIGAIILLIASISAGILGRMGGAKGYNTKFRDLGVPLIFTGLMIWLLWRSFNVGLLLASTVAFGALLGALTTYWQFLWGYDNLWFSGFCCGLTAFPYIPCTYKWGGFLVRSLLLAIIWGTLNKYLPKKFIIDRAVAEEFLRYFALVATAPLLLF